MTTQETLVQIEHLLVEHEETLRNELAYNLINKLIVEAQCDFLDSIKDSNGKNYEEIPEAKEMLAVVIWLKKVKQEMKDE